MKIYTKKGDKGETSLPSSGVISKGQPIFDFLGTLDETSACLGLAKSYMCDRGFIEKIEVIQSALLSIGALVAGSEAPIKNKLVELSADFEKQIDEWDLVLPKLTNFILPDGGSASASLHLARTVTRRAERCLNKIALPDSKEISIFLNRLSDYLFVMARMVGDKNSEKIWKV